MNMGCKINKNQIKLVLAIYRDQVLHPYKNIIKDFINTNRMILMTIREVESTGEKQNLKNHLLKVIVLTSEAKQNKNVKQETQPQETKTIKV